MTPALELTSVPPWALGPVRPVADLSGRSWTVIALDAAADDIVADWVNQIEESARGAVRVHHAADDHRARQVLSDDLDHAVVGWRLMIAGPADACLRLRSHAMACGVADDEMTVASTETTRRDVSCAHCATVTSASVQLQEVTPCSGCGRNLFVYYHVSRRLGAHLGFMVDAEQSR